LIRGDFVELDEDGNPKEDGIRAEEILVSLEMIRDEEIKKLFPGKQKTDSVIFDPVAAYQNRHEVGHLLKITHEEADQLNSNFQFTIYEISELQNAELNEELYQKVYGEETEIKTEEDFRNQLKEEIAESLLSSSEARFATDVREALLEKINPQLPEAFLKRWLQKTNKELDEEQIDQEFDGFLKDLRWQLIKEAIITDNELEVEKEEVLELARQVILAQYSYYGIYNLTEEQLDSFVKSMMNKPEDMERLYMQVLEKKVINLVRSKVTIENKEVSSEEFEKSLK
jgi:trigger factor